MGLYSKYLYQLIQSVAHGLDDCKTVTATTGSSNTLLVNSQLTQADDFWNGWWGHVFAGTNAGQTSRASDFHNANTTIVFSPAFTAALATNSQVELHRQFTYEQYKDVINRAIEMGKDAYLLDTIDETTTLVTDTYEYNVPSGIKYITNVFIEDSSDANTYYDSGHIDGRHFRIIPCNATTSKLKFSDNTYPIGSSINGQKLRIEGFKVQGNLTNDDDTCELPPEFVINQARALLLDTIKGKESLADRAQVKADKERSRMRTILPPGVKTVFER